GCIKDRGGLRDGSPGGSEGKHLRRRRLVVLPPVEQLTGDDVCRFPSRPRNHRRSDPCGSQSLRGEPVAAIAKEHDSEFDCKLLVILKETSEPIGECKLGRPGEDGISETDVKLLPEFWGRGFGTEVKQGLVDYLFTHTSCQAVKATPNKLNRASQKMQEAVGGKKVGEEHYRFPDHMRTNTMDVDCFVYKVFRDDWEQRDRLRRAEPNRSRPSKDSR
ncbi:GNAT family N-acetyltransferase, partial [Planctomycetota bacterium]